jgi:hypothetical protein
MLLSLLAFSCEFVAGIDSCGELAQAVVAENQGKKRHPEIVHWEDNSPRHVIDVALGGQHLLVVARHENLQSKVYASGLNTWGQLGLGDLTNRDVLVHVRCGRVLFSWCPSFMLSLFPYNCLAHRWRNWTVKILQKSLVGKISPLHCRVTACTSTRSGAP